MPPLAAKDWLSFHQIAQSNFYQRFHAREEAHSTQLPHLTIPPTSVESEKTKVQVVGHFIMLVF